MTCNTLYTKHFPVSQLETRTYLGVVHMDPSVKSCNQNLAAWCDKWNRLPFNCRKYTMLLCILIEVSMIERVLCYKYNYHTVCYLDGCKPWVAYAYVLFSSLIQCCIQYVIHIQSQYKISTYVVWIMHIVYEELFALYFDLWLGNMKPNWPYDLLIFNISVPVNKNNITPLPVLNQSIRWKFLLWIKKSRFTYFWICDETQKS